LITIGKKRKVERELEVLKSEGEIEA